MMDQSEAAELLLRWNVLMHEHWSELQTLRAAEVGERRIEALYPNRGHGDYAVKLCKLLDNPKAFSILHRRFKADRQLLLSSQTGWSAEFEPEADGRTPASQTIAFGTAQTGEVVDCLHRLYPRKFKRWPASAHEFASAMLVLPVLAEVISQSEVRKLYRFTLGANRKATDITLNKLGDDIERVLLLAQQVQQPQSKRLKLPVKKSV